MQTLWPVTSSFKPFFDSVKDSDTVNLPVITVLAYSLNGFLNMAEEDSRQLLLLSIVNRYGSRKYISCQRKINFELPEEQIRLGLCCTLIFSASEMVIGLYIIYTEIARYSHNSCHKCI